MPRAGEHGNLADRRGREWIAEPACVWPAIDALPGRFDTLLSRSFDAAEAGATTLSGGQWQRIALACSLMRAHADLVVLDEPSAGLDAEAAHELHQTLRAHCHGRTTLLISHWLSALRGAEAVVPPGHVAVAGDNTGRSQDSRHR